MAKDIEENPQLSANVSRNKYLTADTSALLTDEGKEYLRRIAIDYLASVQPEQPVILVTPSFRLAKQALHVASGVRGFDPNLPRMGLELCLDSINLCKDALNLSERKSDSTLLAMSLGPPFDCYKGEDTPDDVDGKYLPQTFAALRFGNGLDYLMFETVPSLRAAIGAARSFKKAHEEFNIDDHLESLQKVETIEYMGNILSVLQVARISAGGISPSYDAQNKAFLPIDRTKDFVIYFCLEEDGTLNGKELNSAINELYKNIAHEGIYEPAGFGINCNSPEVTHQALLRLSDDNLSRLIGIHPNASSERNPRNYREMRVQHTIPQEHYIKLISDMANEFQLKIVGGCCGTNHHTMTGLASAIGQR